MATISEAEYQTRIRQLEALNHTLSEQVDRQAKVVEAALAWNRTNHRDLVHIEATLDALGDTCDAYERELAELMKEGGRDDRKD